MIPSRTTICVVPRTALKPGGGASMTQQAMLDFMTKISVIS